MVDLKFGLTKIGTKFADYSQQLAWKKVVMVTLKSLEESIDSGLYSEIKNKFNAIKPPSKIIVKITVPEHIQILKDNFEMFCVFDEQGKFLGLDLVKLEDNFINTFEKDLGSSGFTKVTQNGKTYYEVVADTKKMYDDILKVILGVPGLRNLLTNNKAKTSYDFIKTFKSKVK